MLTPFGCAYLILYPLGHFATQSALCNLSLRFLGVFPSYGNNFQGFAPPCSCDGVSVILKHRAPLKVGDNIIVSYRINVVDMWEIFGIRNEGHRYKAMYTINLKLPGRQGYAECHIALLLLV